MGNNLFTSLTIAFIDGDFTPDLEQSETFKSNDHFIIKKQTHAI